MILDTHEAVEKMVEAGASKKMAEAIVALHAKGNENLATKEDIREVKSEIKMLEVTLRSEITEVRSELKSDIAEVKGDIKVLAAQFSTMKWIQYSILALLLAPMVAQFVALYFK
jgi:dsDNA-specific endonuclease/ATPase MutS2